MTHFQLASKRVCVSLGREGGCSRVFCVIVVVCVLGILCLFDCVCLYVFVFFFFIVSHTFNLPQRESVFPWGCAHEIANRRLLDSISSTCPVKYYIYYLSGEIIYSSSCPVKYFLVLLAV